MNGKLAIIGCGNWGQNLVRNFYNLLGPGQVICCDQRQEVLQGLKAKYPGVTTATDVRLICEDPSVSALVIATPVLTHYSMARQALLMGKHVLIEKPMTTKSREAEELCDLADREQRVLMVDHLLLFHPAVQELKGIISSGDLGDVYHLYSRRTNLGVVRSEENVLWSLGPHDVAVILELVGAVPTRIVAHGGAYLQAGLGIEDVVFLTMVFPGGQFADLHLSWLDPRKVREIVVVGSRKMAVFDDMEPLHKLRIHDKGGEFPSGAGTLSIRSGPVTEPPLATDEPLALTCQRFLDSIETGSAGLSDGRTGLEVVRILEAAQASLAGNGIPIEFSRECAHG